MDFIVDFQRTQIDIAHVFHPFLNWTSSNGSNSCLNPAISEITFAFSLLKLLTLSPNKVILFSSLFIFNSFFWTSSFNLFLSANSCLNPAYSFLSSFCFPFNKELLLETIFDNSFNSLLKFWISLSCSLIILMMFSFSGPIISTTWVSMFFSLVINKISFSVKSSLDFSSSSSLDIAEEFCFSVIFLDTSALFGDKSFKMDLFELILYLKLIFLYLKSLYPDLELISLFLLWKLLN